MTGSAVTGVSPAAATATGASVTGASVLLLSNTDGNVLGSAKVVKRTSLRGRMLAKWPAAVVVNRPLKCPQERPWRAPVGHAA
ncbi:hypothetical protein Ate01nite_50850 [Actinoplanes teichomyceticus]|nr:hypothetical protein Ate01nite_50850 [Actinoplanes teichomyceticus]